MAPIDEIYNAYYKDVYRFVLALCKDSFVAEDIAQETFTKAIKAIKQFKGDCDIKVWLCQIAKNTYFTYEKKHKREVGDPEEIFEKTASGYDFVQETIREEDAMRVHKILHDMKEPYKEVFTLRVFGELSFKQIATIHGKTESWARVTYHRARVLITEKLEG